MAYELVTVKGVRDVKGKDGREHHFLNLTVSVNATIYMDATAISLAGLYERFTGKQCLLSCDWTERDGKAVLQLNDDSFPVDVPPELLRRGMAPSRNVSSEMPFEVDEDGVIKGGVKDGQPAADEKPAAAPSPNAPPGLFRK